MTIEPNNHGNDNHDNTTNKYNYIFQQMHFKSCFESRLMKNGRQISAEVLSILHWEQNLFTSPAME